MEYWHGRHEAERAREQREAEHWTKTVPPNVVIDTGHRLRKRLDKPEVGKRAFRGDRERLERQLEEKDQLTPFLERNGIDLKVAWKKIQPPPRRGTTGGSGVVAGHDAPSSGTAAQRTDPSALDSTLSSQ
uniref:Uncharacterized protein n=1 Tax=Haptolina ericina TaxID=156174 RepID=A0A7S3AI68_9EUKA